MSTWNLSFSDAVLGHSSSPWFVRRSGMDFEMSLTGTNPVSVDFFTEIFPPLQNMPGDLIYMNTLARTKLNKPLMNPVKRRDLLSLWEMYGALDWSRDLKPKSLIVRRKPNIRPSTNTSTNRGLLTKCAPKAHGPFASGCLSNVQALRCQGSFNYSRFPGHTAWAENSHNDSHKADSSHSTPRGVRKTLWYVPCPSPSFPAVVWQVSCCSGVLLHSKPQRWTPLIPRWPNSGPGPTHMRVIELWAGVQLSDTFLQVLFLHHRSQSHKGFGLHYG